MLACMGRAASPLNHSASIKEKLMSAKTIRTPYGQMPLTESAYQSTYQSAEAAMMRALKDSGQYCDSGFDCARVKHDIHELWRCFNTLIAHHIVASAQASPNSDARPSLELKTSSRTRPAFTGEFGDGGE